MRCGKFREMGSDWSAERISGLVGSTGAGAGLGDPDVIDSVYSGCTGRYLVSGRERGESIYYNVTYFCPLSYSLRGSFPGYKSSLSRWYKLISCSSGVDEDFISYRKLANILLIGT